MRIGQGSGNWRRYVSHGIAALIVVAGVSACSDDADDDSGSVSEIGEETDSSSVSGSSGSGSSSVSGMGMEPDTPAFSKEEADVVIPVIATEWVVSVQVDEIPAGKVYFDIQNAGAKRHELVLVPAGAETEEINMGEQENIPFGMTGGLAVTLTPGDYRLACFIIETEPDGTVEDHFKNSMYTDITVV